MLEAIKCLIIDIINLFFNTFLNWTIDIILWILALLPHTPFIFEPIDWGPFGKAVGYYVPITKMFLHLGYALVAIAVWYGIQHIARMLKMIR